MDIVALVAYDGTEPADAIRSIEVGEADVLLVAHSDVLGPPDICAAIIARVEQLGGHLCCASVSRVGPESPDLPALAGRMLRQGLRAEQIADVLRIDVSRAKALIRRAGNLKLPGLALIGLWAQDRLGRLAVAATLAAGLVVGEHVWQAPPDSQPDTVQSVPMSQRPRPPRPVSPVPAPPASAGAPAPRPSTPPVSAPSPLPSPSTSPTTSPLPLPTPSLDGCLTSPLDCATGLLPST
jgi:hypothetical protein